MRVKHRLWLGLVLLMTLAALYQETIRAGCAQSSFHYAQENPSIKPKYCSVGDWTKCPLRHGIDRRKGIKRLAILVSGQLSRLEIASKLEHLIKSNRGRFEFFAVFLLSIGETKASNYHNRVEGPVRFEDWLDLDKVEAELEEHFGRISKVYRSRMLCSKNVVCRQVFYFSVLDTQGIPLAHVAFGLTQSESPQKILLHPNLSAPVREVAKQKNQQDMFRNMRQTMMLLEDIEIRMRLVTDFVLRIREDNFILRPLHLEYDPTWSDHLFMTPKCWTSGGFSDSTFLMGRAIASKVLRGFVEEYYISLDAHYRNPERYVKSLVKRYQCQILHRHVCEWPVLPILFQMKHSKLYMHLRYQSYMDATRACGAESYTGSCVFREADSLIHRKDVLYDKKLFSTWT